jgi:TonB family protein
MKSTGFTTPLRHRTPWEQTSDGKFPETRTLVNMLRVLVLPALIFGFAASNLAAQTSPQTNPRPLRIAFLDFGKTTTGRLVTERLAQSYQNQAGRDFQVLDRDQARAAALGAGYQGSVNMTLEEARDLASAMGCDFFFAGEAQTLRRTPLEGAPYFESYAAIYLVSGRTGKLIWWERPSLERTTPEDAEKALLKEVTAAEVIHRYEAEILRVQKIESAARAAAIETAAPVIEVMSEDADDSNRDVRAPRPFRRLKPPYPETAARAEVEAIVDVLVDIDAQGEVGRLEIARWAGYGLDQSVLDTVRQMHFFPAMREGTAIPMRVLLRYNFRKPPPPKR